MNGFFSINKRLRIPSTKNISLLCRKKKNDDVGFDTILAGIKNLTSGVNFCPRISDQQKAINRMQKVKKSKVFEEVYHENEEFLDLLNILEE